MTDINTFFSCLCISLQEKNLSTFQKLYDSLSITERKSYINAVYCLGSPYSFESNLRTPLLIAAHHNNNQFIKYLLKECGAEPHICCYDATSESYQHAGNILLQKGNFVGFELCLTYGNPHRLISHNNGSEKSTLNILKNLMNFNLGSRHLDYKATFMIYKVLEHSDISKANDFNRFIQKSKNIHSCNKKLILDMYKRVLRLKNTLPMSAATPGEITQKLHTQQKLLPSLADIKSISFRSTQTHLQNPISVGSAFPHRSVSFDSKSFRHSQSVNYAREFKMFPSVSHGTFIRLFQSKFMKFYLDALLSLDLSNFGGSLQDIIAGVKESLESLTGISSCIADSMMSALQASKKACISDTIRKAAKLLIMADGPSGMNKQRFHKSTLGSYDENDYQNTECENCDTLSVNRNNQARMNNIAAQLAIQILRYQTNLTSLSYDAMIHRIDMMIKKIFKYINSDRFNPMVAGYSNEIHAIVLQLYQGHLEPVDDRPRHERALNNYRERVKQSTFGYYYINHNTNETHYFLPKRVIKSKSMVSHFRPMPESVNFKLYPEIPKLRIFNMMKKQMVFDLFSRIRDIPKLSNAYLKRSTCYNIQKKIIQFLNDEIQDSLFIPEKNQHYRNILFKLMMDTLIMYAHTSDYKKNCSMFFLGNRSRQHKTILFHEHQKIENTGQSLNIQDRLKLEISRSPHLKPFSRHLLLMLHTKKNEQHCILPAIKQ